MVLHDINTKEETARYLGVSTKTLETWSKQGKIKPVTLSRKYVRYTREEIQRVLGIGGSE